MAMPDMVLVESQCARNEYLSNVPDDRALEVLGKVKTLMFATVGELQFATSEQMADFYEVPVETVKTIAQRNKQELVSDGLKTLKGKDLRGAKLKLSLAPNTSIKVTQLVGWTPRAAVRLGMMLTKSEVATSLRTTLLNLVEYTANASLRAELEREKARPKLLPEQEQKLLLLPAIEQKLIETEAQLNRTHQQLTALQNGTQWMQAFVHECLEQRQGGGASTIEMYRVYMWFCKHHKKPYLSETFEFVAELERVIGTEYRNRNHKCDPYFETWRHLYIKNPYRDIAIAFTKTFRGTTISY